MREPGGAHCGERCLPDKQGGREEVIINHGLAPVHRRINAVEMIFSVPVGPDKVIVTSGSACSPRSWSVCDFVISLAADEASRLCLSQLSAFLERVVRQAFGVGGISLALLT